MEMRSILVGLAIGICSFAVSWATVRHFTGLAAEHSLALAIAIAIGVVVGGGYTLLESSQFDMWLRRRHR